MDYKVIFFSKQTETCKYAVEFLLSSLGKDNVRIFTGKKEDTFPVLNNMRTDYIISFLSPWIIPQSILKKAKIAPINFHPGSLKYPGTGCYNFALYEGAKKYGVTCHVMKKKVDTGQIIATLDFNIHENDTVESLKLKSMLHLLVLFHKIIEKISSNKELGYINKSWRAKPYTKKRLDSLCIIDRKNMSEEEIRRRIRATEYIKEFGPYENISSKKVYLSNYRLKFPNI